MSAYTAAVARGLRGLKAVSTGACPGCQDCADAWGYNNLDAFRDAWESGAVHDEASFSWSGCDICGSSLGGDMEPWHAIDANGELCHFAHACVDCILYLANGDEPDDWR